jgi:hypothetical protein
VQVVLRRNSKAKRSLRNVFDNRVDSFLPGCSTNPLWRAKDPPRNCREQPGTPSAIHTPVVMSWDSKNWDAWLMEPQAKALEDTGVFRRSGARRSVAAGRNRSNKAPTRTSSSRLGVGRANDRGTIWIVPGGFPSTEGPETPSYKALTNPTSIVNSRPPEGKAAGWLIASGQQ